MPADPETLQAIHAFGENLRNAIGAELRAHKEEADRARSRIYERIDSHARESRETQKENTAELRGAISALGLQVTELSTRFGAHEKADEKEFERVDDAIKDASNKRHGYFQAFIASVFTAVAGWVLWIFKGGVEK